MVLRKLEKHHNSVKDKRAFHKSYQTSEVSMLLRFFVGVWFFNFKSSITIEK